MKRIRYVPRRGELAGGERVDEELADRVQVWCCRLAERIRADVSESDLGAAAIGCAFVSADEFASLHAAKMVRESATFPADVHSQFG